MGQLWGGHLGGGIPFPKGFSLGRSKKESGQDPGGSIRGGGQLGGGTVSDLFEAAEKKERKQMSSRRPCSRQPCKNSIFSFGIERLTP